MSWPKPVSKPHPPVFGGLPASERNFTRLARWADGWIPMGSPLSTTAKAGGFDALPIEHCIAAIHKELEAVGRNPSTFRLISIQIHLGPDELKVAVSRAVELGVERINVKLSDRPTDETVRTLDTVADTLHQLLG